MVQSRHGCFVHTLDHFVLTVSNIPVTVQFYTTVLGMRALQFETSDGEVRWALAYGASKINLHQSGREFEPKAAHSKPGSADLCFLTDTSIETWIPKG
jgi:catechol 2,3-dioxygenase-like lactoylglutathione lyase family enzyme